MSPATIRRDQTKDAESFINTRQDRGIFITGGGKWTWDASASQLSWDEDITVYVNSIGKHTIPAGSVGGLDVAGKCARIVIDRSGPSTVSMTSDNISDPVFDSDDVIPIAVRATDDRLHVRDGTVFSHGETKLIGTGEQIVDRVITVSDGRLNPEPYPVGREIGNDIDGDTTAGGGNFHSLNMNFSSVIPNTLGEPDTLTFININGYGIFQVVNVVDPDNLTVTPIPPPVSGATFQVYDNCFGYINGNGQLLVHVDGVIQMEGTDYDETGSPGETRYDVVFRAGMEPAASQNVGFINISGGQGPQGNAGIVDCQDVYDASPQIIGNTSTGPLDLDWPGGADVVLQTKISGGPTPSTILHADGTLEIRELRISDDAGGQWSIRGFAPGNLRLEHMGSGKGFEFSPAGGMSFYDTAGSPLGFSRWAEYSGTFGTPATAVVISTGITNIKGVILKIEDNGASEFYLAEFNRASTTTAKAVVHVDSAGNITIDGDFAGGDLGTDFDGGDYHLLVFYE